MTGILTRSSAPLAFKRLEAQGPPPLDADPDFFGDWADFLGSSIQALGDDGVWPFVDDRSGITRCEVVVRPTAVNWPMANAFRVSYHGVKDGLSTLGSVRVRASDSLWSISGTQSLFMRYYQYQAIRDGRQNSTGGTTLGEGSNHPWQPEPGSCPGEWTHKMSSLADGTYKRRLHMINGNRRHDIILNKFEAQLHEVRYKRVGADTYQLASRLNEVENTTDYSNSMGGDVGILDSCLSSQLFIGQSDPATWRKQFEPNPLSWNDPDGPDPDLDFFYWGAPAIRVSESQNDWIGAYQLGRGW